MTGVPQQEPAPERQSNANTGADQEDVQIPIPELLEIVLHEGASDLHITAGSPPQIRLHGDLVRLDQYPIMTPRGLQGMIYAILPQRHREHLEQDLELDMSLPCPARLVFV